MSRGVQVHVMDPALPIGSGTHGVFRGTLTRADDGRGLIYTVQHSSHSGREVKRIVSDGEDMRHEYVCHERGESTCGEAESGETMTWLDPSDMSLLN